MAKRPSVKEILEAARRGGPAHLAAEAGAAESPAAESMAPAAESAAAETPEAVVPAAPPPAPAPLGRPLTLKEKLAAARAGAAAAPAAPAPKAAPAPAPEPAAAPAEAAPAEAAPAAAALGRPLTLKEKLAAARGAAAAPSGAAPAAKPAAAKPAAGAAAKAAPRQLPPLDKMSDPKDLAEAARQAGAKKTKEVAAQAAASAPVKAPAKPKETKPQTVLPRPSRASAAARHAVAIAERRGFLLGSLFVSWIFVAWATFTAGCAAFTAMMGRFMFPNVLAEPPSTIKIGLPSNFDPEDVNERFKAEWGFWIVRSARVESQNGQDIIYALKSVCTHLGCPPNWLAGEQKFKCPCHGSGFYITGVNFEGPAPRPLERFKVAVADDGQIVVDKSQIFQQELGQWSDPDSFVPA